MDSSLSLVFYLMVAFQVKHFAADFPLQREYMLKKRLPGWDYVLPLAVHCLVHMAFSLTIILMVNPSLWWLALVDFASHFVMDRVKSSPKMLGRFSDKNKSSYWNCFGLDQMVHHLTHYFIIFSLVMSQV